MFQSSDDLLDLSNEQRRPIKQTLERYHNWIEWISSTTLADCSSYVCMLMLEHWVNVIQFPKVLEIITVAESPKRFESKIQKNNVLDWALPKVKTIRENKTQCKTTKEKTCSRFLTHWTEDKMGKETIYPDSPLRAECFCRHGWCKRESSILYEVPGGFY